MPVPIHTSEGKIVKGKSGVSVKPSPGLRAIGQHLCMRYSLNQ